MTFLKSPKWNAPLQGISMISCMSSSHHNLNGNGVKKGLMSFWRENLQANFGNWTHQVIGLTTPKSEVKPYEFLVPDLIPAVVWICRPQKLPDLAPRDVACLGAVLRCSRARRGERPDPYAYLPLAGHATGRWDLQGSCFQGIVTWRLFFWRTWNKMNKTYQ